MQSLLPQVVSQPSVSLVQYTKCYFYVTITYNTYDCVVSVYKVITFVKVKGESTIVIFIKCFAHSNNNIQVM